MSWPPMSGTFHNFLPVSIDHAVSPVFGVVASTVLPSGVNATRCTWSPPCRSGLATKVSSRDILPVVRSQIWTS